MQSPIPLLISALLLLSSCFGLFDSGTDTIVDEYEVSWINSHRSRAIYNPEEQIPAYIFAIGHNDEYIIAKQHPLALSAEGQEIVDCTRTVFYILDIVRNRRYSRQGITGPLTTAQFQQQVRLLKLENIRFTLIYPDCL